MPMIRIRGRSFMALIVAPEPPLQDWFAALDEQMQRAAGFFADRPIIANLAALDIDEALDVVLDALVERDLKVIGIEGIDPLRLAGTAYERLTNLVQRLDDGRKDVTDRLLTVPDEMTAALPPQAMPAAPPPAITSLLIDRPVRSGQSIIFEDGDVTVIGSVASGAEIIAGGSIHIYGALRGRAIAGLKAGAAARIFCQKLAAELIAIDGLYSTAEHWSADFFGRAVQIQFDQGSLRLFALD